jgi:hypothetical protein
MIKTAKATANSAPILLVYGQNGRGKTTLASKFPAPLAFLLERGLPRGVTVDAVEGINTFDAVMAALLDIYNEPPEHQTLLFDTIDQLERLAIEHMCKANGWPTIETPPFGKGWITLDSAWNRFIRAITAIRDKHGISIVLVCHAEVVRIEDPRAPAYTSYQPNLHKRARGLIMDASDAVLFLAEDLRTVSETGGFSERTRATAGAGRFLFCEGRPAFAAKNRFGMPEKIPLSLDFNFSDLARYWQTAKE